MPIKPRVPPPYSAIPSVGKLELRYSLPLAPQFCETANLAAGGGGGYSAIVCDTREHKCDWLSDALQVIEFFRGRHLGGRNVSSLLRFSGPKMSLFYLKACTPVK